MVINGETVRKAVDKILEAAELIRLAGKMLESESSETTVPAEVSHPDVSEKKAPTLADVRALLAEKSRDGFTAQVRDIITARGANKLSEIDPLEFPAIMKEAEALGDG